MADVKISVFEVILLIVGVAVSLLGFQIINRVFVSEGQMGWLMVIAIFGWLILLILITSLSLSVENSKKELSEMKKLVSLLENKKSRKL